MGMHADCGHGTIMATSMAQLHMQAMPVRLRLNTQTSLLSSMASCPTVEAQSSGILEQL